MTGKLNPVLLLSKVELIQVKPESIHKHTEKVKESKINNKESSKPLPL